MKGSAEAKLDSPEKRHAQAAELAQAGRKAETQGALGDSLEKLTAALAYLPESEPSSLRADILRWLGTTHRELGQTGHAAARYKQSMNIAQEIGYVGGEAHALNCLAIIAQRRGDMEEAQSLYRKAGRQAAHGGDHRLEGMVEQNLGVLANIQGDLDSALVRYRASLRAFEEGHFEAGMSWVLNNLGMLHTDLGKFAEAERHFLRGLEIAIRGNDLHTRALLESNLAEVYIGLEEWDRAEDYVQRALTIAEERGDPLRRAGALKFLGIIQRAKGHLALAELSLTTASALADESEDVLLAAELARERGETQALLGDIPEARRLFEWAAELFRSINAGLDATEVERRLAQIEAASP